MAKVDMPWVKEQLTNNKTKRVVGDHVIALLEKWEELKNTDPDPQKNEANLSQIIELFGKLALGHAIIVDTKNERWVPAQSGQIVVADEVRVKWNAFDGDMGKLHNGRRGKVVSIRYGDIIVKTTDGKEPVLRWISLHASTARETSSIVNSAIFKFRVDGSDYQNDPVDKAKKEFLGLLIFELEELRKVCFL
jgi:hypothetical protein